MEEKAKKILEAMEQAGKPLKPGEIAQLVGMDSKEISKIIENLKKEGLIESPKRCYYSPKKDKA